MEGEKEDKLGLDVLRRVNWTPISAARNPRGQM